MKHELYKSLAIEQVGLLGNILSEMRLFLIFTAILCALNFNANAQCFADAGNSKISCPADLDADSIQIGGSPSASAGIVPYNYSWSIEPIQWFPGSFKIYASDILDDTTSSNPYIIDRWAEDTITFYLKVTDSVGNSCIDSTQIIFSNFIYSLAIRYYSINFGDSIFLNDGVNIDGGIGNLTYLWRPNHGLTDSTQATGFWTKPDSSLRYYVTVTDELGCSDRGPDFYFITVNHIGIDENKLDALVTVFPNPTTNILNISMKELRPYKVSLYNVVGQEIYTTSMFKEQIDISILPNGIYILTLETDKGIVRKKIKKQ